MQVRLIIAAIILSLSGGLWYAIDAAAGGRAGLKNEQARTAALAKQVAGVAEQYQGRINSNEEAYRVRDSLRYEADTRRGAAEAGLERHRGEGNSWDGASVPAAVTTSLCLKPGSCAGRVPPATQAAAGAAAPGTGDATERTLRLTNESLRAGVESLRHDLAVCNGQIAGIYAWCESLTGGCEPANVINKQR